MTFEQRPGLIDSLIVTGEDKWNQASGLGEFIRVFFVIFLFVPMGYCSLFLHIDLVFATVLSPPPSSWLRAGPEHSSARLERFLQLVNDDPDVTPGYSPELVNELEEAFHRVDVKGTGFIDRKQLCELLMEQDPTPSQSPRKLNSSTVATFDGNGAYHQKRSQLLLMNEITNLSSASSDQRYSCEEYKNYASTWIRRHYEQNYNISVCNTTTPSQYFHVLRRQVHRPFVKPLVLCTGKWLQHHSACICSRTWGQTHGSVA